MHFVQTYDLATQKGRVGFIGIHTPSANAVHRLYPGFFQNFKRWRPVACDITLACASLLPADPLQVGVEAGDIAPQDMFNPILFRAVSNDSMDMVMSRVKNRVVGNVLPTSVAGLSDVVDIPDPFPSYSDDANETLYYNLLASEGWRKAMPQAGLRMTNLVPLVYEVIGNFGNTGGIAGTSPAISASSTSVVAQDGSGSNLANSSTGLGFWRGRTLQLPSVPTRVINSTTPAGAYPDGPADSGGTPTLGTCPINYVALMVMPPAKLNVLYYRMRVDWSIEWYEPCSLMDMSMPGYVSTSNPTYYNTYDEASKNMESFEDTVDTNSADLNKIMESGH